MANPKWDAKQTCYNCDADDYADDNFEGFYVPDDTSNDSEE